MRLTSYLWVLPFIAFFLGYQATRLFSGTTAFVMPSLLGKSITESLKLIAGNNLTVKIIEEREMQDLASGTVLAQTPQTGQRIKPYQTVFLTISKPKPVLTAPCLVGLSLKERERILASLAHVQVNYVYLISNTLTDNCIAQVPCAGDSLTENKLLLYISAGSQPVRLMPDFRSKTVQDTLEFLKSYMLEPCIFHAYDVGPEHTCQDCIVLDQRPLPNSAVNIAKNFKLQLRVGLPE